MYKKVWISQDMDGCIDIWSKKPWYESGCFYDAPSLLCGYFDYLKKKNNNYFNIINRQLGIPKKGDIWSVTFVDGTFYY